VIGIDTNVLVRHIMQDDAVQSAKASQLLESLAADTPGFVPMVVIAELSWVLASAYELERTQLVQAFEGLLRSREIVVEQAEVVWRAVHAFAGSNADFADCLVERSAAAAGCDRTMTFDRGAVKASGMTLVG
jgi:predicted nucleic-acid-binding protein